MERDEPQEQPALYELLDPELPDRLEPQSERATRCLFCKAIEEHTPEVLRSLQDDVLPFYRALSIEVAKRTYANLGLQPLGLKGLEINPLFDTGHLPVTWWAVQSGMYEGNEAFALWKALRKWSEKYHLTEEWLRDLALHTLFYWREKVAGKPLDLLWHQLPSIEGVFDGQGDEIEFSSGAGQEFSNEGWNVGDQAWHEYRNFLRAAFDQFLADYHRRTIKQAVLGGWSKADDIRDNQQRFKWLALNLVKGLNPTEILKSFPWLNVSPSNIAKQMTLTAQQVGVTHRSSKGRPRKSESPS